MEVHQSPSNSLNAPIIWRPPFFFTRQVVYHTNPQGTITKCDLDLAGTIGHNDVLASLTNLTHVVTCSLSENTPDISWRTKCRTTTTGPVDYLLKMYSIHRWHYIYEPDLHHIPVSINSIADNCSCLWYLNNSQLFDYFILNYPQKVFWQLCHLREEMHSALISSLRRKRSPPESYLPGIERLKIPGTYGVCFSLQSMQTQTFKKWLTLFLYSRPLGYDVATDAFLPGGGRGITVLVQWRTTLGLSAITFQQWR